MENGGTKIAPQRGLSYGQANSSPRGAISAHFFFSVKCFAILWGNMPRAHKERGFVFSLSSQQMCIILQTDISSLHVHQLDMCQSCVLFPCGPCTHKMQGCHRVVNALSLVATIGLSGLSRWQCLFWQPTGQRLSHHTTWCKLWVVRLTTFGCQHWQLLGWQPKGCRYWQRFWHLSYPLLFCVRGFVKLLLFPKNGVL